ncbi:MAG: VanZ family protein [Candidatus Brocadia sp.]|nr:VanZ family protein [Candidatus Brocadia sp.]
MKLKIKVHWIFKCLLTVAYASFIYYASSQDTSSVPLPSYSDKVIHFFVFGLLCLMICWSLSSVTIGSKWIYKIILAIGITSLYGASDEFHQFFTPNRSVDILDWLVDTGGAVTAGFLWHIATYNRQIK